MTDTSPRAARRYRELLMRRTASERLAMATSMFDAARLMLISGIRERFPGIDEKGLRVQIFLQTYAADLPPRLRDRVVARICSGP